MYICAFCKKPSSPRMSCHKIVTATKTIHHPVRNKVNKKLVIDKSGRNKIEWQDDPGGVGLQIVREVNACAECARKIGR